jgi:integration host factor subunit beta
VAVPAKRVPFFKPSKELRDLVNPGEAKGGRKSAKVGSEDEVHLPIDPHHPPAM